MQKHMKTTIAIAASCLSKRVSIAFLFYICARIQLVRVHVDSLIILCLTLDKLALLFVVPVSFILSPLPFIGRDKLNVRNV